ncbi:MAG: DUF3592 domain-containing protein [Thermoanaerobaculia bacterium]|nr:DUF3592 domain-containing protein [Thermoanaerobaculia bacterium]
MSASDPFAGDPRRARRPPKVWLGVGLLALFTGIGVLGTVAVAIDWLQGLETWSWEETSCTVLSSRVVPRPEVGDHLFEVTYGFRWAGGDRVGSTYRHGYAGSDDEAEARVLASRYRPGDALSCWVDPEDPARSALLRADLWRGLWIFVPLLFVAVGGGALWLLLGGAGQETKERPRPLREGVRGFKAPVAVVGLFGLFFLVGTGMLLPFFVWPALDVLEARSWSQVPCEIVESGVRYHRGDDSTTYSVEVLFRYEVDGRKYLSNRYRFLGGSSSGYEGKARVVAEIPPGTRTTCFVDPDAPEEAVLNRGLSGDMLFGLIPLLFALVGAGGLWATYRMARRARADAAEPPWRRAPPVEESAPEMGPVVLEPAAGPLGRLVGAALVALFWNGFVGIFVWHVAAEWRRGNPDWFAALVLTPFVLIGLLIASGIPYTVLALANPRPRLRLSRGRLAPGESVQLEWSFRGFAGRLRKLTIHLVGAPRSVLSRGVDGALEHPDATSVELVERLRGQGLEHGAVTLAIPEDARPTQREEDDPYVWKLALHGEIAYWPDVRTSYELEVDRG